MKNTAKNTQTAPAPSSNLKTRCRDLTVLDYIRLVCEDDLSVLIAAGKPLAHELEAARTEVLTELSGLSGNDGPSATKMLLGNIYALKAQRLSFIAAMGAMADCFDESKEFFRSCGVNVDGWSFDTVDKHLKRVNAEIKAIDVRLAAKVKEYNSMAAKSGERETVEKDIRAEMAILGQHQGFAITDNCNLADYASYRQSFNNHLKALESAKQKTNQQQYRQ
jgi:hypothetical protein